MDLEKLKQIEYEFRSKRPDRIVNGVRVDLWDTLVVLYYKDQVNIVRKVNHVEHLQDSVYPAFPGKYAIAINQHFVSGWRNGKHVVKRDTPGGLKLIFFSRILFPGYEPKDLYTSQIFNRDRRSETAPRLITYCGLCKLPIFKRGEDIHKKKNSGYFHKDCHSLLSNRKDLDKVKVWRSPYVY